MDLEGGHPEEGGHPVVGNIKIMFEKPDDVNIEAEDKLSTEESTDLDVEREGNQESLIDYPIVDHDETIYSVEIKEYFNVAKESGVIYKLRRRGLYNKNEIPEYCLRENIAGEDFIIRAVSSIDGVYYSIDYSSEKYKYALMNFAPEDRRKLNLVLVSFIDKVLKTDENVRGLKFSGAPTSYTKDDVDDARMVLKNAVGEEIDDIDSSDPTRVRDNLYAVGITDTKLQKSRVDFSLKREAVFRYTFSKLFKKYGLPYEVAQDDEYDLENIIKRK